MSNKQTHKPYFDLASKKLRYRTTRKDQTDDVARFSLSSVHSSLSDERISEPLAS
jgi:hypothetical protein